MRALHQRPDMIYRANVATCQTSVGEVKVLSDWVHHVPHGPAHQSGNKKISWKKKENYKVINGGLKNENNINTLV